MKLSKSQIQAKQDIHTAVMETLALLQKSSDLEKESEEMQPEEEAEESAETPPQAAEEEGKPADTPEEEATEVADPSVEAQEPEGEQPDLATHLASMQDEELHELIDAALSELEGRSAGAPEAEEDGLQGEPDQAPEAAPAPAPQADNGMAAQMDEMNKSIKALASSLAKSQAPAKAAAPKISNAKPVVANRVEVLQKSEPKVQRLSKSETVEFLLNQQRNGSRIVNSQVLAKANYAKTEEELHSFQDQLTKAGVTFPKL